MIWLFEAMLLAYRKKDPVFARELIASYRLAIADVSRQAGLLGLFRFFYSEVRELLADGRPIGINPIFWSTWRSFLYKKWNLFYFVLAKEVFVPGVCIIATVAGVFSSSALLTTKVLPLVYDVLPAHLEITPVLACVLTALVVEIRAYDQLRRSRRASWFIRLLGCYCAGLLWPYWLSTPLIARLKRWRRKRPPASRPASRTTNPAVSPDAPAHAPATSRPHTSAWGVSLSRVDFFAERLSDEVEISFDSKNLPLGWVVKGTSGQLTRRPRRPGAKLDPRQARRGAVHSAMRRDMRRQNFTQGVIIPALCKIATVVVLIGTVLLSIRVLPLVYGTLPANLGLTSVLACVLLRALIVEIRAHDQLRLR